jgi:hypothetical protein
LFSSVCHVPQVLFCLSYSAWPVLPVRLCLSCPGLSTQNRKRKGQLYGPRKKWIHPEVLLFCKSTILWQFCFAAGTFLLRCHCVLYCIVIVLISNVWFRRCTFLWSILFVL